MKYSKQFIINGLRRYPEQLPKMMPEFKTVEEAVSALEAHPGKWVVDGELLAPEDPRNPDLDEVM